MSSRSSNQLRQLIVVDKYISGKTQLAEIPPLDFSGHDEANSGKRRGVENIPRESSRDRSLN
jgi:hypothetical protein